MSSASKPSVSPVVANTLLVILCGIWGSTWLVIREGLRDLPPFFSAGARFAVAGALMFVLAGLLRRREGGDPPPTWLWLTSALCNFTLSYGVVYWCEQTLPSGLVSLLWAVFPMLVAVSGHLLLPGERLDAGRWLGFALGFAGVAVLFRTDLDGLGAGAVGTGLLLLVSPVVSCVGNTAVKKYGESVSSVLLNRNGMSLAAVLLLAVALITERDAAIALTPRALFSLMYLSVVGTVVTFSLYFWLLRFVPAHRLSLIAYVTPAIALFLGWAIGGEPVTGFTLAGAGLILTGILLVVAPWSIRRRNRRSAAPVTPAASATPATPAATAAPAGESDG